MARSDGRKKRAAYDAEFKLRVLKAAISKEMTLEEVSKTFGIPATTYYAWKAAHDKGGEAELRKRTRGDRSALPAALDPAKENLKRRITEVNKEHPYFGIGRVWQWLRRMFFLPVSYRQVRATMKEANLVKPMPKRKRRASKPRRIEASRPNQLWCSDITNFTIGRNLMAYVIGFIDAYSRYIVSWGIYAAATSELVIEVLKRGFDTYGYPKGLLTDNGTQYKVRRGKTNFQKLMLREDINHLSTRPRHPQGNGIIEAFWGNMKKEFVVEAPLGALEDVRERLGHWMNFYNWQRMHTEMGNATPAERYFEFEEEARREIEKRIKANEKELAFGRAQRLIGEASAGTKPVIVTKEGDEFVVRMDGQVVKRTTLDPKKEKKHDAQESGAAGAAGDEGRGSEGEGGGGSGGPVRGEADLGDLPPDGPQADPVLQAREPDGGSDADGRGDAGHAGAPAQSAGGSGHPRREVGSAPPGVPADAEPDESVAEAREVEEERPEGAGKAAEGGGASLAPGGGGSPKAGPSAGDGASATVDPL